MEQGEGRGSWNGKLVLCQRRTQCGRRIVRLRAELLSALIGSISLIPFIISSGTGAEIEKPLAIVVVGGLVTRPIKIVVLPMVYEWVERRAARRAGRRAQATPA